ncbi:Zn(2+)-responsive transcriptional regulator [Aliikangiella marina]|uniref:Zn(2+)-responsive transcriptional regulator n=1 Tax=Aliikangiella marina TaxID=1712262 RepID=A0A545T8Z0_9GAMM|nr:Zn(2+)-responsive transcriptional regulator [Aliikangiella marina]TQV73655.1 Zn(2+)-responsive transcriptional regulator [Aliikangiella marina]
MSENSAVFKIGELAKKVGSTVETLRFYETKGLLQSHSRSAAGYRLYNDSHLTQLSFILQAKKVGFSLKEIKYLLGLNLAKEAHTCEEVKTYTGEKIAEIDAKIRDLQSIRGSLHQMYEACCGGTEKATHCSILHTLAASDLSTELGARQ